MPFAALQPWQGQVTPWLTARMRPLTVERLEAAADAIGVCETALYAQLVLRIEPKRKHRLYCPPSSPIEPSIALAGRKEIPFAELY